MVLQRSWKFYAGILSFFLILFLLLLISFAVTPLKISSSTYIYKVKSGSTFKSVASDLHRERVLGQPLIFNFLVFITGTTHQLKAGEYAIQRGTTPYQLIKQLSNGQGLVLHAFRIIPGETFQQLRLNLNADLNLLHKTKSLTNEALMKKLGAKIINPEGQFFPDTYFFVTNSSDYVVLKQAYQAMQSKLQKAWITRAKDLPFSNSYEALIAASLVEKEAFLVEEKPLIAGVLLNRLRKKTLLQFDPTVIYGLGQSYTGDIRKQDLTDSSNLYNTYVFKGLPPTPIAMPDLASINAVLHPEGDYFYFVATGKGGAHQFSKNLNEHNEAVLQARKYRPVPFNIGILKKVLLRGSLQAEVS